MANEVDLVVRAKNEATRAIDSVTDALKKLTGVQDDLSKSAEKTGGPLGRFAEELAKLGGEAQSIQSLGKVGEIVKVIGERSERAEKSVAKTSQALQTLSTDAEKAAAATGALKSKLDATEKAFKEQAAAAKEAKTAQTLANEEYRRAERALTTLEKKLQETSAPSEDLMRQVIAQRELTASLKATKDAASGAYAAQQTAREKAASSLKELTAQIRTAERAEKDIGNEIAKTTEAHKKNTAAAGAARDNLAKVNVIATETTATFGDLATNEVAAAKAAAEVEAQIARVTAAMERQKQLDARTAQVTRAAPKDDQAELIRQTATVAKLKGEWQAAKTELNRLAAEVNSAEVVTKELGNAFKLADLAADQAAQAFRTEAMALDQLNAKMKQAQFAQFASSNQAATNSTRALAAEARSTGTAFSGAGRGAGVFKEALGGIYGEGRQALSLLQRIRGEILSLTSAYVGFFAVVQGLGKVIDSFRALEAAQNRLGAVFEQDTGRVAQEINFLRAQASRLGIEFSTLSDEYTKFAVAANAANFSSENTRKIFISVAEAGRVNKLSNEQLQGAFLALQQMVSKGKVSAQELQQQLGERLPGAVTIFAKALGISNAELIKLQETGSVLASESNILKFAEELDRRFGPQLQKSLTTTSTEIGRFQNSLFNASLQVAAGGFIDSFTELLHSMNAFFGSQEGAKFFLSLGAALGRATDAVKLLVDNFGILKTVFAAIATIKVVGIFQNLSAAMTATQATSVATIGTWGKLKNTLGGVVLAYRLTAVQMQATANTSRVAIGAMTAANLAMAGIQRAAGLAAAGLRLLTGALGGIPGIILTVATIGFTQWLTSVDQTTAAVEEHKRIMVEVQRAYDTVVGTTKDWVKELKSANIIEIDQSVVKLRDSLASLRKQANFGDIFEATKDIFGNATLEAGSGQEQLARMVQEVQRAFAAGRVSAQSYKEILLDLYSSATDQGVKDYITGLNSVAEKAAETENSLAQASLIAKEAGSNLSGLDRDAARAGKTIDDIFKPAVEDAAKTMGQDWKESFDKINDAMDKAGEKIPGIAEELKRLGEIDALQKLYRQALQFARSMSEVEAITKRFQASADAINFEFADKASSSFAKKVVGVESNGITDAKNPLSTATGLGQFIQSTWLSMFKKYFPDTAATMTDATILALRKDASTSIKMVELYAQENAKILQQAGVAVNDASLYLAHFLGPQGAVKVLTSPANTPTSQILAPQQIDANKSILEGKTNTDVIEWAQKKMNITEAELGVRAKIVELETKSAEKAAEFKTSEEQRIQLLEDQAANEGKISKEMAIQKAVADYTKRAKEAGVPIDQAQIERIKTATAAEWERNAALRSNKAELAEGNQLLATANALSTQRTAILAQIKTATAAGDTTALTGFQNQLTSVNARLTEAIAAAQKFWEAVGGGPQAEAALAKLDALKVKTTSVQTQFSYFGLNMSQISSLVGSFADGIGTALDSFVTAVVNGENAMKALKTAFLQFAANFLREIAMMIIKQMVLNALSGIGGPIGTAAKALAAGGSVPTGHTGGRLGAGVVGAGNVSKTVSPAVFSGAMRYHGGGIVGLKPDEVAMIGKQNEEMLTENDPRHRNNGGLAGGNGQAINLRSVLVMDQEVGRSIVNSADNEKATMSFIKKNRATVRQSLGIR